MATQATKIKTFPIIIRNRLGVLYEGEIETFSSFNDTGEFDVLAFHINFITLIHTSLTLRLRGQVVKQLPVESGVLAVRGGQAEVYLGILHQDSIDS